MKNLKIRLKLVLGFATVILFTILVGITGIIGMVNLNKAHVNLYDTKTKPMAEIANIIDYSQRVRMDLRNTAIYTGNTTQLTNIQSTLNQEIRVLEEHIGQYETMITDDQIREAFYIAKDTYYNVLKPLLLDTMEKALAGEDQIVLSRNIAGYGEDASRIVDNFNLCLTLGLEQTELAAEQNEITTRNIIIIVTAVLLVSIVVATALSIYIAALIVGPLNLLNSFLLRFSTTGDLRLTDDDIRNIENRSNDEIGQCIGAAEAFVSRITTLGETFALVADGDLTASVDVLSENDSFGESISEMLDNLVVMFNELAVTSEQVSAGASQVAQGAQALATGSTQQAVSIEEFSANTSSIEEKIKDNAENSKKAREATGNAEIKLSESMDFMHQMLEATKQIEESSSLITKVIKVIEDIAFQTNILALNAAVEAARAGQHGKGFAVVAEEVRSLASKSADAAKETADLIEGSSQKVNEGAQIVERTNNSLQVVSGITQELFIIVDSVAKASDEQTKAMESMSNSISQISSVVQSNSATAEESAAAAQQMSAQSSILNNLMSRYKLKPLSNGPSILGRSDQNSQNLPIEGKY